MVFSFSGVKHLIPSQTCFHHMHFHPCYVSNLRFETASLKSTGLLIPWDPFWQRGWTFEISNEFEFFSSLPPSNICSSLPASTFFRACLPQIFAICSPLSLELGPDGLLGKAKGVGGSSNCCSHLFANVLKTFWECLQTFWKRCKSLKHHLHNDLGSGRRLDEMLWLFPINSTRKEQIVWVQLQGSLVGGAGSGWLQTLLGSKSSNANCDTIYQRRRTQTQGPHYIIKGIRS